MTTWNYLRPPLVIWGQGVEVSAAARPWWEITKANQREGWPYDPIWAAHAISDMYARRFLLEYRFWLARRWMIPLTEYLLLWQFHPLVAVVSLTPTAPGVLRRGVEIMTTDESFNLVEDWKAVYEDDVVLVALRPAIYWPPAKSYN